MVNTPAVHPANPTPQWNRAFEQPWREVYIFAGCFVCQPDLTHIWAGKDAPGQVRTHYQATGHRCWEDRQVFTEWGKPDA